MIQKGIIEQVIDKYKVKVRIPKYNKIAAASDGTKTESLPIAIINAVPGINSSYLVGDVVLVSFENNELARPVVIGLLYRDIDTSTQIKIPSVENKLQVIEDKLSNIDTTLNTYVRYSNDEGKSFTSLYDIARVEETYDGLSFFYECKVMEINNKSKIIYWCIVDENNIEVTDNYKIETTITDNLTYEDSKEKYRTTDSLIEVPINFIGLEKIYLSFKILKTKNLDKCRIILTTDKDLIGTVRGNYIGICVTNEKAAPINLSAYSWMSVYETSEMFLQTLSSIITVKKNRITGKVSALGIFTDSEEELEDNSVTINGIINGGFKIYTDVPKSPNIYGTKVCVLKTAPDVMYSGWLYLIEDGDTPGPVPPGPTPVEGMEYFMVDDGDPSSAAYYLVKERTN